MVFVYEIILHLALLIGLPLLIVRPRLRERLSERFGNWPPLVYDRLRGGKVVWIHCASVGEVQAARPLVLRLIALYPKRRFLVTTMTTTGLRQAENNFGKLASVALIPIDSMFFLRKVFAHFTPETVLIFETELWPQFIRLARESGAKLILVNGRLSARSFPRYKLIRGLIGQLLAQFDLLLMSGQESAERILALGAPAGRVQVLGNVKWAGCEASTTKRVVPGWPVDAPVLLAGSTHEGEDALVLNAFEDLLQYYPAARLILAPRHPQRVPEVEKLLRDRGLAYGKRMTETPDTPSVYILDTVGELTSFFSLATTVFLGGSFVPVGGHNVLEPAAAGTPVLFGPHMENFTEISAALEACGGAIRVADWQGLAKELRLLWADPARAQKMGSAGRKLVAENSMILDNYVNVLREVFDDRKTV